MSTTIRSLLFWLVSLHGLAANGAEVDFAHDVVPLLKQQCAKCHGGSQKKGGYSINDRESLLAGGESGVAVVVGKSKQSELYQRITSSDDSLRMPPEGEPLTARQVELLARWIDEGATWEAGFSFGPRLYEPPLKPRLPELPPAVAERTHPVDRILDAYLAQRNLQPPRPLDDAAFQRRASLDLIGLLPTPDERQAFLDDRSPDKRARLVRSLLDRDIDYAEHWLTFWNDLLRNDYAGTGFITGGRKQISAWLYEALVTNKPYDQFARELIAPSTPGSAGFADGIRWRGEVSAGQTVEIQFAQSVGQAFLGINLKCASCHDSFIDRWTLEDAYGLAAIYAQRPLELHRCDKPIGKTARPAWLFDELGQVDPAAPQPQRLQQLAALMTHRENGRFTRTIVNRLWHRLMGRGIVHPTDAMQSEPWNADLLDYLAERLVEDGYDLKKTLERIATSQAYQSKGERAIGDTDGDKYQYAGPRAKRLTAEQFMDCVWQLTGAAPQKFDAPIVRGKSDPSAAHETPVAGAWIWNRADVGNAAAGETIAFRKEWPLKDVPAQVTAVVTCDNEYTLYVNGKRLHAGTNWEAPDLIALTNLKAGQNEILLVGKNGGSGPNPAGLFFEARWTDADGTPRRIVSDESWQWSAQLPNASGKYRQPPEDWQPAVRVSAQQVWMSRLERELARLLSRGGGASQLMVRASLLKSDFLMRSLGRPNRDQIVSVRPLELTTLEAIDLANGEALAGVLRRGAETLLARDWKSPQELIEWLYEFSLSRPPTAEELAILTEAIGPELNTAAIEDILWSIVMLPEFQIVR
ncbi:MAG: DUF1549 domain-containing protein [Pirellulaceae bacterium]|nr:DUF1549 domain-containing protein [Pirellulaceae bacterium]